MRDVRSSPPPVPKDAGWRAVNRAHADAQKRRKDAKAAKRTKHILAHEELDKRRRQQWKDGLPLEESPSTSLSTEASDGDDKVEGGRGPLDHLPDVMEVAPGVSALKASPGSSAHWVAEAQAAIQCGAASARVDPKGPVTHGGVAEAAPTQSDGAVVPFVAEAPGASEAEAMEATAPMTAETAVATVGVSASAEDTMAEAGAPETAEAVIAEAGAPEVTEAVVMAARPSVQEAETQAAEASAVPLAQGPPLLRESARETEVYPISSDDTSRAREVVDAEETDAVEQPAPLLDKGGSTLVRVRPEPRGWDHPWEEADAAVAKLMEAAEGPGAALATLFEEEVVPPLPSAGAKGPEP
ncbi:uncharacterized protein [Miscanthus floridulus]|uniref:uncharacterized protein n=1 Tax=Miscanthus floridulus TaxID=154761 RepID=UPI00345A91F5